MPAHPVCSLQHSLKRSASKPAKRSNEHLTCPLGAALVADPEHAFGGSGAAALGRDTHRPQTCGSSTMPCLTTLVSPSRMPLDCFCWSRVSCSMRASYRARRSLRLAAPSCLPLPFSSRTIFVDANSKTPSRGCAHLLRHSRFPKASASPMLR